MIRVPKALCYFVLPLAIVIVFDQAAAMNQARAQENYVVQRAKRELTLTGYTRSRTTVTISSEVAGRILQINYDVGGTIGKLPFLDIDPTFIDLDIAATRKNLEQLKITSQKRRSRVDYLNKDFGRIEKLFQRGSSTESRLDIVREDLVQARFDLQAVGIEIDITQTRLRELRERKSRHTVYAPQGWIVIPKLVEAGELVTIGTPLARVADYEQLVVPLSVSDQELAAIQQLAPEFDVRLDGQSAKAAINWINPEFDEKTRKLNMELALHSYPGPRRGGLTCRLTLQTDAEGLSVPKQAVISRYENPRVFLAASGEEVQVLVLGQTESHLIIADDPRLLPGTALRAPAAVRAKAATAPEPGR
jgi:RND family efflux transporter MFP subunit